MQVEPQAQSILLTTPAGGLQLEPGRQVVARVVEVSVDSGGALISLGGKLLSVQSNVPLAAGDTLQLTVQGTQDGSVRLSLNQPPATPVAQASQSQPVSVQAAAPDGGDLPAPVVDRRLAEIAPTAIRELARAGVPVTPQLAQVVSRTIERLVGSPVADTGAAVAQPGTAAQAGTARGDAAIVARQAPQPQAAPPLNAGDVEVAAKAVANLVARNLTLSSAAATRVAAALDAAGSLGDDLARLAQASPQIARALPAVPPGAAALRTLVSGTLAPAELALARIAQATQAATQAAAQAQPAGNPAPPQVVSANPAVASSYVASQVAHSASLDELARPPQPAVTPPPAAGSSQASQQGSTQAPATAQQAAAAVRGDSGTTTQAVVRGESSIAAQVQGNTEARVTRPLGEPPPAASQPATTTNRPSSAPTAAASASDAAGAGGARAATPPQLAQAVAELSSAVVRFAGALAPGEGAIGQTAQALARGGSEIASQPPAGSFTPQRAGGSEAGGPAPLVAAMEQTLLGSRTGDAEQQASRALLTAMATSSEGTIAAALQRLPESGTLRLAGMMLDLAASMSGTTPNPALAADLRHAIHNALEDIGTALRGGMTAEHDVLRAALEQVARNDPRPAVAEQAQRLLAAADGQQLLSAPRTGADPGYVYFQLPLPGNRSAEVMVRREAGRRTITFDQFNIAFLLNTESLGSLMVQLEAHPAAVRATIKTDLPQVEPFLAQQAENLKGPVEREARRPVHINVGVFEDGPAPTTLLEPRLGLIPGENAYYA